MTLTRLFAALLLLALLSASSPPAAYALHGQMQVPVPTVDVPQQQPPTDEPTTTIDEALAVLEQSPGTARLASLLDEFQAAGGVLEFAELPTRVVNGQIQAIVLGSFQPRSGAFAGRLRVNDLLRVAPPEAAASVLAHEAVHLEDQLRFGTEFGRLTFQTEFGCQLTEFNGFVGGIVAWEELRPRVDRGDLSPAARQIISLLDSDLRLLRSALAAGQTETLFDFIGERYQDVCGMAAAGEDLEPQEPLNELPEPTRVPLRNRETKRVD